MEQLLESLPFLAAPFAACLVIASLHCYMGLHVIQRGVIFVDLALAQTAALGAAVALFVMPFVCRHPGPCPAEPSAALDTEAQLAEQLDRQGDARTESALGAKDNVGEPHQHAAHEHEHKGLAYGMSLLFALAGAVLLSFGRLRDERIPHEAIIGIIFVVCASLNVLLLSKAPHGHERMEAMLVGSILFVSWQQVAAMLVLYLILGVFHIGLARQFVEISRNVGAAEKAGKRVRLWDCLFYGSFALMVTQSVNVAGVLVVFSYLIIPAACACLLTDRFGSQLVLAWIVAAVTTVLGLALSAAGDLPTGASLVSCFGAVLVLFAVVRALLPRRSHLT
ncbi:MAG: metal ABC transporter permease [Phycisphaerales bacterium]|nr:MAG: metal ABC transporter permease [Phycisphaerales bacterium]